MSKHFFNKIFGEEIVFENSWKNMSISQINELINDFPGKKEFIEFYFTHNGGVFTKGAYFFPYDYYNLSNDYKSIEIGSFFHISVPEDDEDSNYTSSIEDGKDRRSDYSEEFEDFVLFHFPFADNHADNDFWIDIQTGEIKYMDYEESYDPNNAIIVARSFLDFCKRIKARLK